MLVVTNTALLEKNGFKHVKIKETDSWYKNILSTESVTVALSVGPYLNDSTQDPDEIRLYVAWDKSVEEIDYSSICINEIGKLIACGVVEYRK